MASEPEGWSTWRARSPALVWSAGTALGVIFLVSVGAFIGFSAYFRMGREVVLMASLILAAIDVMVIAALPAHAHPAFGYANGVTALRAALVSLFAAAAFLADGFGTQAGLTWAMVALVLFALAMDGIDGYLARRFRHESEFGARFDMEIDALLILLLSAAVMMLGKAGVWVLLIGLMRYGFVAAQRFAPRLAAPLPPSFRRKLVCVFQVAALCLMLTPLVSSSLGAWIAAAALVALVYSFAVDIDYLLRRADADR